MDIDKLRDLIDDAISAAATAAWQDSTRQDESEAGETRAVLEAFLSDAEDAQETPEPAPVGIVELPGQFRLFA